MNKYQILFIISLAIMAVAEVGLLWGYNMGAKGAITLLAFGGGSAASVAFGAMWFKRRKEMKERLKR